MFAFFNTFAQKLNPTFDPSLSAIDLCGLSSKHNEAVCWAGLLVGDVQARCNADFVRQSWEAGASKTFVQESCKQTTVNDGRVTAQQWSKVSDLNQRGQLSLGVGKCEGGCSNLVLALQSSGSQVVRSHVLGDLHVRPRLGVLWVCAQRLGEGIRDYTIVDFFCLRALWHIQGQSLGIGRWLKEAIGSLDGRSDRHGYTGSGCKNKESGCA